MPSNLETYREWENTGSRTTVHVMQIDRGDLSAANRLTLTDKPFVDKGVSGTRYHHTYPAPIQCILSDFVTNESLDRTSFDDIVISNATGRFDTILTAANIIGHRFTVLRGDQSWSLLETDYPNRFVEIIRGQIESVSSNFGKIRLKVIPVKYKLDSLIASREAPIHYGTCRNVPALLVDSASDEYRFSTLQADDWTGLQHRFRVRDKGAAMAATTDYTQEDESGIFKTKIALVGGAPDGKLTADLDMKDSDENLTPLIHSVRRVIQEELIDDEPEAIHTSAGNVGGGFTFADGDSKFYFVDAYFMKEYTLSTPGNVSTRSVQGEIAISNADGTPRGIRINADGSIIRTTMATVINQYDLSTEYDIESAVLDVSFDTTTPLGGADRAMDIEVPPTEDKMFVLDKDGIVYRFTITSGDISTATDKTVVLRLQPYSSSSTYRTMRFSADGTSVYFMSPDWNVLTQYHCIEPYEIENAFSAKRSFHPHYFEFNTNDKMIDAAVSSDGTKVYFGHNGQNLLQGWGPIADHDLPRDLISLNTFNEHFSYSAGVFYNSETQVGKVLKDLLSSIAVGYTVGRLGNLIATQLDDPNDTLSSWVNVYDIYLSAFIGERGEHILHNRTETAKKHITVRFDKNFSVQSESELAGSVGEDDKQYYSSAYELTSYSNTLANHIDPPDLLVDTFLGNDRTNAYTLAVYVGGFWSQDREFYTWSTNLRWQSLLSDFDIGSIIAVNGDIRNPNFSDGDRVMVTGRRINWSKNKQTLTVFK